MHGTHAKVYISIILSPIAGTVLNMQFITCIYLHKVNDKEFGHEGTEVIVSGISLMMAMVSSHCNKCLTVASAHFDPCVCVTVHIYTLG